MSTTTRDRVPVALTLGDSDSAGVSGIQVALKTFVDHGMHGLSAVTAITARNTTGVARVDPIPVPSLLAQLEAVFADMPVHAIQIGMLPGPDHARAVVDFLTDRGDLPPIVIDPVLAAGAIRVLDDEGLAILREELLPLATVATPDLDEARHLSEGAVTRDALEAWATQAPCPLLLTGGDEAVGGPITDVLVDGPAMRRWRRPRLEGPGFHGAGCTLSSAIASRLARGDDLETATDRAITYVATLMNAAQHWRPGAGPHVLPHGLVSSPLADRTPLAAPWSML